MTKTILAAAILLTTSIAYSSPASAMYGGGGFFNLNPDQYLTIAEKKQWEKRRLAGKTKVLYPFDTNRLRALEEDAYFLRSHNRHKARKGKKR